MKMFTTIFFIINSLLLLAQEKATVPETIITSDKSVTALWEENKEFKEILKNGISTSPLLPETKPFVIRCIGSVNEDPKPMYIIDGVPLNAEDFKQLNPDDIINISVLKNVENTSIFGCRRTGDVIIVKTKNGLTKKEKRKLKRENKKLEKA